MSDETEAVEPETYEADVYVAWDADGNVGLGSSPEEAFESLDETSDNGLRRIARIAVELPEPTVEDAGTVVVKGGRPPLKIVD